MDLSFYTKHSVFSDPGQYAYLYTGLPDGLAELVEVVQGVLMHHSVADLYHVQLNGQRNQENRLRTISQRLENIVSLGGGPLVVSRPASERQVGNCRDFTLLLVSSLRQKGVPARSRAGFAKYLDPDGPFWLTHWVAEVWDSRQERWRLVDAQIDAAQRDYYEVKANTLDLKQNVDFSFGGQVWEGCRKGQLKPLLYRYSGHYKGMPSVRGQLLHDFDNLNRYELSAYDALDQLAGRPESQLSVEDKALLDKIGRLTSDADRNLEEILRLHESLPRRSEIETKLRWMGIIPAEEEHSAALNMLENSQTISDRKSKPRRVYVPFDIPEDSELATLTEEQAPANPAVADGEIVVKGARQHNLKHIDVRIPRNQMVVITGVSGSGKSSLAFDTIYAEGQRRYVESLSSYARQFMGQMEKPQVDQITGLSPAVAIEQKTISRNPRSTVGTVTEILDYLRVIFARLGEPHCPQCGRSVQPQSAQKIVNRLLALPEGTRFELLAPLVRGRKGTHANTIKQARQDGFTRVRIDGERFDLLDKTSLPDLDKNKKHVIEAGVDRLVIPASPDDDFDSRLTDSVETALKAGEGIVIVEMETETILLSTYHACPVCDLSFAELQPSLFSFNSPQGMCPECNGLGVKLQVDPELIITNPELSLLEGASPWYRNLKKKGDSAWQVQNLKAIADHYQVDLSVPWRELPETFQQVILYGAGDKKIDFEYESRDGSFKGQFSREVKGVVQNINRLFRQTHSEYTRQFYMQFMRQLPCPVCQGERLCPEARFVTVGKKRLPEITSYSISALSDWIDELPAALDSEQLVIGGELLEEISQRLKFIRHVGLHYLNLDRPAPTLSGGEGQRIRLASQIGSGLVGVLYVLDEPSIGLHARDHRALLDTLGQLRNQGNTVLVVEHDADTMRTADYLVDLGPGAGVMGGYVVASGTPAEVMQNSASITGKYLSGELKVSPPNGNQRRKPSGWLTLRGARLHNLKSIDVAFPLGVLSCITGVSGSGKSSLIAHTLFPALDRVLHRAQCVPGPYEALEGLEQINKVINITQEPIGRNPRSNPGTYVGVLDDIRRVFAGTPEARALGFNADRFSFNVKGGRCESCAGYGYKRVEMHFLADIWVRCKECNGKRFNRQTLDILYKGKNIADVLDMDVQEACEFFANHPQIYPTLKTLQDVGLEYIKLGQSATTLSGGEAQRVKLAKELCRASTGRTLYILDEPTTGLHFSDVQRLLDVLSRLVDAGNTVIIIEHNMDVIGSADWIIDMGPEGGDEGGYLVAQGTPEDLARVDESHTGRFLAEMKPGMV